MLDLGAAEGYFTFRLAENFDGVFTAVEHDKSRGILDLCQRNDNEKLFCTSLWCGILAFLLFLKA